MPSSGFFTTLLAYSTALLVSFSEFFSSGLCSLLDLCAGYYKPDPKNKYDETSPGGDFDYLSQLCTAWEEAAKLPKELDSVRQVILRCGKFGI
jgi:NAD dependent epimerase/dehydratase family enzyme